MSIKVMKQALESIDWLRHHLTQHHSCLHMKPTDSGIPEWLNKTESDLRQAIEQDTSAYQRGYMDGIAKGLRMEQAEQAQPVAWRTFDGEGGYDYRDYDMNEAYAHEWATRNPRHVGWVDALYTAPPQRQPLPPQSPCEMTPAERKMFRLGWLECEAAHGIKGEA